MSLKLCYFVNSLSAFEIPAGLRSEGFKFLGNSIQLLRAKGNIL